MPQVKDKEVAFRVKEAERKSAEEKLATDREARILAEAVAADAEKRQEEKRIISWRKSIKTQMETNCGPVIDVKGDLIKVYSPVRDYGNEHWIRRDTIFPQNYSCRWVNGIYVAP